MLEIFAVIHALGQVLQQKKQNFLNRTKLIKATTITLRKYHTDNSWDVFWEKATVEEARQEVDIPDDPPEHNHSLSQRVDSDPSSKHRFTSSKIFIGLPYTSQ